MGSLPCHLNDSQFYYNLVKISMVRFEEPPSTFIALTLSFYLKNATTLTQLS